MEKFHNNPTDLLSKWVGKANALKESGRIEEALACGPEIIKANFWLEQGYQIPQEFPQKFTEKLYNRILDIHERDKGLYTRLSDKLAVREHIANVIGEKYLTPLLWRGVAAREIPWDSLPQTAVLKCNEGSRKNLFIDKKIDIKSVVKIANEWQSVSYYWFRREYQYWDAPRQLMIEEQLVDGHSDGPLDYLFYCFNGIPKIVQVGSRSHSIHRFYNANWEALELAYRDHYEAPVIARPDKLEEMLTVAARLSDGIDFVRVDLYCCLDGVFFGEMTFTPRAGFLPFKPREWDERLGDWWIYNRNQGRTR